MVTNPSAYACSFVMPSQGTFVTLRFETRVGEPGSLEGTICNNPDISGSGNNGGEAIDGTALVGAIGDAAADVIKGLKLGVLLKAGAILLTFPNEGADGQLNLTLSSPGTVAQHRIRARSIIAVTRTTVAKGRSQLLNGGETQLRMKLTKLGRSLLKTKRRITLYLQATIKLNGNRLTYKSKSKKLTPSK